MYIYSYIEKSAKIFSSLFLVSFTKSSYIKLITGFGTERSLTFKKHYYGNYIIYFRCVCGYRLIDDRGHVCELYGNQNSKEGY